MQDQQILSVFCYAFRPLTPASPKDGGFSANLYTNGMIVFCLYDTAKRVTATYSFQLGQELLSRYYRMTAYAAPWLRNVPDHMSGGDEAKAEYTFGISGQPLFRIEDLQEQMNRGFRTIRGHYSRLVYGLFEDIASLLAVYGIDLLPHTFQWESSMITPVVTQAAAPSSISQTSAQVS